MRIAVVVVAALLLLLPRGAWAAGTAFYFGPNVPRELTAHFDRVVVDPDAQVEPGSARLFARVSLGEVPPGRRWRGDLPQLLVVGRSRTGGEVVDAASAEWAALVLDRVLEPAYGKGYRGFFFDGIDTHKDVGLDRGAQLRGMGAIVSQLRARHPDVQILAFRELLPGADGLVADALFEGYDASTRRYGPVVKERSDAKLAALRAVQAKGTPVTVVDYAMRDRKKVAAQIAAAGFEPYVTSAAFDEIGVGRVEIVPRRMMMLYKGAAEYLGTHDACVLMAPILEHYGYAIDYVDVRKPLPEASLAGRYAGVVVFVPEGTDDEGGLRRFLLRQIEAGIKIAFVEGFGFHADPAFLGRLGLAAANPQVKPPVKIVKESPLVGYEAQPRPRIRERPPVFAARADVTSLFRVEDADKNVWDGVVMAPWGGAAFIPYVLEQGLADVRRWILDPFKFLHDALDMQPMPMPDVTTESGRRILTAHIDGDAFVSRAERRGTPYTATVILDEILKVYRIPHTVSVVEGEVGPDGLNPKDTPRLEAIAREIFKLSHVELASHTFSHPFFWEDAEAGKTEPHGVEPVHLRIPGYKFSLERDIKGSIDYVNTRLAPPGKKVRVLLWSGSCSPSKEAVALTRKLGVFNVNGGGATRTFAMPSMTRGSAMGIPKGDGAYQVFAPVENENVYTNDFLGPFYGYRHAIETFKLNEEYLGVPRRLSLITIYYHFYSAAKQAALVALKEVYDWAVKQETTPLYLSEYAAKVHAFQDVTIARVGDAWEIAGDLQTVRLDPSLGWPDMEKSSGVAGVREVPQGRYVTLVGPKATLVFSPGAPSSPHLVHANGRVVSWGKGKIQVKGHMPLSITIGGDKTCTLKGAPGRRAGKETTFTLPQEDTGEAALDCR